MIFVKSARSLGVGSREDWPCAVCRPRKVVESRACCLCLDCVRAMMVAADAGAEEARALLAEITAGLNLLEAHQAGAKLAAN